MRLLVGLLITAVLVSDIVCPPVNQGPAGQVKHAEEETEVSLAAYLIKYRLFIIVFVLLND